VGDTLSRGSSVMLVRFVLWSAADLAAYQAALATL
jgi:hypothetical protein